MALRLCCVVGAWASGRPLALQLIDDEESEEEEEEQAPHEVITINPFPPVLSTSSCRRRSQDSAHAESVNGCKHGL
jgi:hypothetical protein